MACAQMMRPAEVAQKEQTVNQTQSLTLVRNLLRTGISTVLYLRDVFPESEFEEIQFNKQTIMALKPTASDDAKDLTVWLEVTAVTSTSSLTDPHTLLHV